jgi:hypothetical protein
MADPESEKVLTDQTVSGSLPERVALRYAHAVVALFLALGILGSLRTGLDETENLFVFVTAPATALTWLLGGLVGAGFVTSARRAVQLLVVLGPLLLLWGLGGLVIRGDDGMLVHDPQLIAMNLLLGAGAVTVAAAEIRARRRPNSSGGAPADTR